MIGANTLQKHEAKLREMGMRTLREPGTASFKFGDDKVLETRVAVLLPVALGGTLAVLKAYVVPGNAPLLLSNRFLKDL